ncbi:MAG: hypothetical protein IIX27_02370 [Ruminococcus sp.]|nr:hypothetical protein [Ruminococcus sp.]
MKAMVCEMCNSNDLLKQDGMFVCQSCGTKYSVEEAKKLMVEGVVKIDESAKADNFYTMAESAYASGNQSEAETYCNKIIEIDPNNYKAWFLKGKAAGWQSTLAKLRIEESVNCFTKAIENSPQDEIDSIKTKAADELDDLSFALVSLCCDNYAKNGTEGNAEEIKNSVKLITLYSIALLSKCGVSGNDLKAKIATKINESVVAAYQNDIVPDYWGVTRHPSEVAWTRYKSRSFKAIELLEYAINLSDDDSTADIQRYKNIIYILKEVEPSGSYTYSNGSWVKNIINSQDAKQQMINKMMLCHNKIKEIDPSYVVPEPPKPSSGCYVATAVYGSYDCAEVWTLRRFRDDTLAITWYGRAFIKTYYAISPTLVKWFGDTQWFKNMWKPKLDKMVRKLNNKGVENTPYNDKQW